MKLLVLTAAISSVSLSACTTADLPAVSDLPIQAPTLSSEPPQAAVGAERQSIRGCCSFGLPASSTVRGSQGIAIDGFSPVTFTTGNETVTVSPLLGNYGWQGTENGQTISVDRRQARQATISGKGTRVAAPVHRHIDGRDTKLTLSITSSCAVPDKCLGLKHVIQTFRFEDAWQSDQSWFAKPRSRTDVSAL